MAGQEWVGLKSVSLGDTESVRTPCGNGGPPDLSLAEKQSQPSQPVHLRELCHSRTTSVRIKK